MNEKWLKHHLSQCLKLFDHYNRPWTNGQVERMNRTIKETTVKR